MCVCSFEQITATSKEADARFVSKFWILLHWRWLILFCACTMVSMPKQDVPMQTLLTFVCKATCRRNGRFLTTGESKRQTCFKAFLHFFLFLSFFSYRRRALQFRNMLTNKKEIGCSLADFRSRSRISSLKDIFLFLQLCLRPLLPTGTLP